ncbi:SixA phosphatase family protein [Streptomyces sp. NPDC057245]|uniref:SixA phosphatase family protein n=1 Tax=Streptomyces sp. NPDC057245 TaxID=3346065 RepID=UPI00364121FA
MSTDPTRRIVLVRHAKSEENDGDDHERPLSHQGRKEAPETGRWLVSSGVTPDLAVVSTAACTKETWKLIAPALAALPRTVYEERLYEASAGEIIAVLNETSEDVAELVVVGHNPGLQGLAEALAGEAEGDLMSRMNRSGFPNSAAAILTFTGSWKSVEEGIARLTAFRAPNA